MGKKTFFLTSVLVFFLLALPVVAQQEDTPVEDQEVNLQFQVGFNALTNGNLIEATNRFQRAVASDTEIPRAYYWLGKTYFYRGYNDSAVRVLNFADTFPEVRNLARRELARHRRRYAPDTFTFRTEWNYVGLIEGMRHDETRNINPSSLEGDPHGGWYSASYKLGKVLKYSEEGRVLESWRGFGSPTDLKYVPGQGLFVSDLQNNRVSVISDTGDRRTLIAGAVETPTKLLSIDSSLYLVDSAEQRIVQLTLNGDTAGVVWRAPPNVTMVDVTVGPDGNFWILDDQGYRLHVISRDGVKTASHPWNRNLDLGKIWWRRGTLLGGGEQGIVTLDPRTFEATSLSAGGDTLPGGGVSDVHLSGDRLIISSFESSELLIYRPPSVPEPDMLVDQRRFDFSDFPIVRGNVIVQDPLRSHRFEHLGDRNLEINVNGLDILPSILRHTRSTYGNDWIILVDNRISEIRAWEEIRPYMETLIDRSPEGTRGSLWTVAGPSVVEQPFTDLSTKLKNTLNQLDFYPVSQSTQSDTMLPRRIHQAFNTLFSRRSSGGIIVLSRNLDRATNGFRRVMNRAMNNSTPVFFVNPSAQEFQQEALIDGSAGVFYQHFGDLNVGRLWNRYRSFQNHHYTIVYRSNLRYQASSLWRDFELGFHYFDRVFRYHGGFLIP